MAAMAMHPKVDKWFKSTLDPFTEPLVMEDIVSLELTVCNVSELSLTSCSLTRNGNQHSYSPSSCNFSSGGISLLTFSLFIFIFIFLPTLP